MLGENRLWLNMFKMYGCRDVGVETEVYGCEEGEERGEREE